MRQPQRIEPGPGQESVWDYPRPPRLEDSDKHIQVMLNGAAIADTHRAKRVLETSHPPVYYLPPEDVRLAEHFTPRADTSVCEWKGVANYYDITVGDRTVSSAAWTYHRPTGPFAPIEDYIAVYPGKLDTCLVDGEPVQAQPGDFYGGWITAEIVGPFKGDPGTWNW